MKEKHLAGCVILVLLFLLIGVLPAEAKAAGSGLYTVQVQGHYTNPNTGTIEDSGGAGSSALGESMVASVVDTAGLLETDAKGTLYLSVRFKLMKSISKVILEVQEKGADSWKDAETEQTAAGDDTADFRLKIPEEDIVLRASVFVEAMGRDVVFFLTYDGKSDGNTAGFEELPEALPEETESETVREAVTDLKDDVKESSYILDDSVWMVLFLVILCANILSGLLLLLFLFIGRSVLQQHRNENKKRE